MMEFHCHPGQADGVMCGTSRVLTNWHQGTWTCWFLDLESWPVTPRTVNDRNTFADNILLCFSCDRYIVALGANAMNFMF